MPKCLPPPAWTHNGDMDVPNPSPRASFVISREKQTVQVAYSWGWAKDVTSSVTDWIKARMKHLVKAFFFLLFLSLFLLSLLEGSVYVSWGLLAKVKLWLLKRNKIITRGMLSRYLRSIFGNQERELIFWSWPTVIRVNIRREFYFLRARVSPRADFLTRAFYNTLPRNRNKCNFKKTHTVKFRK